jgi:Ca2+-binding RTX toxin-like protein
VDTIIVGAQGQLDFTVVGPFGWFYGYERLSFNSSVGSTALFAATQFGAGYISNSLHVTGVNGPQQVITVVAAHNFSAAHWTFTDWEATDTVGIFGLAANDVLIGSRGTDEIHASLGADIIRGGPGRDFLNGDEDNDTFQFVRTTDSRIGHADFILDFHDGGDNDRIDLHKIDANTKIGGNQAFHFIGVQNFHHKAGELHFIPGADRVTVEGDVNGNGKADFQIDVTNFNHDLSSLVKGDFLL